MELLIFLQKLNVLAFWAILVFWAIIVVSWVILAFWAILVLCLLGSLAVPCLLGLWLQAAVFVLD
jgi:hypothetical protein